MMASKQTPNNDVNRMVNLTPCILPESTMHLLRFSQIMQKVAQQTSDSVKS